mgnify:CR=1 FL=1
MTALWVFFSLFVGAVAVVCCCVFGALVAIWSTHKIGGVTGDVMGAAAEGGEIICLFVFYFAQVCA